MFGSIGGGELLVIFVLALIVFGPRKLPDIGKSLGKMVLEFRKATSDFRETLENEVETEKRSFNDALNATPSSAPAALPPTVEPAEPVVDTVARTPDPETPPRA
jgi:sec-independent protein translocase protein TatA